MERLPTLLLEVAGDVWGALTHLWPFLLASVVIASLLQVYARTERLAGWLRRRTAIAVLTAVAIASLTPFCSCGTTAVVLGAMVSSVPWAPIVAFMVSSPLTSPSEFVLSAGVFGTPFAVVYFVGATLIGISAGVVTAFFERTGALRGQARMQPKPVAVREAVLVDVGGTASADVATAAAPDATESAGCVTAQPQDGCGRTTEPTGGCGAPAESGSGCGTVRPASRRRQLISVMLANARRLVLFFTGFAAVGYLAIRLIPTEVFTTLLGEDSFLSVPLAALLGVPVFLSSEGSLPLVASLMEGGMGPGAGLAFLITGAGTSVGALSGMLIIARWRVVALVVGLLLVGAMLLGWLGPLWL